MSIYVDPFQDFVDIRSIQKLVHSGTVHLNQGYIAWFSSWEEQWGIKVPIMYQACWPHLAFSLCEKNM